MANLKKTTKKKKTTYNIPIDWSKTNPKFADKIDMHIYTEKVKELIKESDIPIKAILYNRKRLKHKFGSVIQIYRGFGDSSIYGTNVSKINNFIMITVKKYNTSWTTSPQIAYNFTETMMNNGKVICVIINVNDTLISYLSSKQLYNKKEYEIILIKNPKLWDLHIYKVKEFKKMYKIKDITWSNKYDKKLI